MPNYLRICICLFCIFVVPYNSGEVLAQDYSIESFEIAPTDLTAKTNARTDANGHVCALIKVYVKDSIMTTNGPVIGSVVDRGLEKWVYIANNAKKITLFFKDHKPISINFIDYEYPILTGKMTYILKLKERHSYFSNQTSSTSTEPLDPIIQELIDNMIYVEGGTYSMGADDSNAYDDEKPVHIEAVESFHIGKYEVTQKEWRIVMKSNPSKFKGNDLPVENISWNECQEFIQKLNNMTGKNFRLPSEAEWEYAARGGNLSNGYRHSGGNELDKVAWHHYNSGKKTHIVGTKAANELGLYDMSGNVWEWTSSNMSSDYSMPRNSSLLVDRGGSWNSNERSCRVSNRSCIDRSYRDSSIGFRLVF